MVVIQANPELDTGNQYGVMRESVPNNLSISQWIVYPGTVGVTGMKGFAGLVNDIIREYDVGFLCLMETHISGARVRSIVNRMSLDGCFMVEAQGFAGGIWCLWNSSLWKVRVLESSNQYVHLLLQRTGKIGFWRAFMQAHILNSELICGGTFGGLQQIWISPGAHWGILMQFLEILRGMVGPLQPLWEETMLSRTVFLIVTSWILGTKVHPFLGDVGIHLSD